MPLKRAAPSAPKPLRRVIEQMMAAQPSRRFQDITQVRRAFEGMLVGVPRSMNSILVGFLRARQRISESEALARLTRTELAQRSAESLREVEPRRPRWGLALALGLLLGLALATASRWLPAMESTFEALRRRT